jgi:hypothetical protein
MKLGILLVGLVLATGSLSREQAAPCLCKASGATTSLPTDSTSCAVTRGRHSKADDRGQRRSSDHERDPQ